MKGVPFRPFPPLFSRVASDSCSLLVFGSFETSGQVEAFWFFPLSPLSPDQRSFTSIRFRQEARCCRLGLVKVLAKQKLCQPLGPVFPESTGQRKRPWFLALLRQARPLPRPEKKKTKVAKNCSEQVFRRLSSFRPSPACLETQDAVLPFCKQVLLKLVIWRHQCPLQGMTSLRSIAPEFQKIPMNHSESCCTRESAEQVARRRTLHLGGQFRVKATPHGSMSIWRT